MFKIPFWSFSNSPPAKKFLPPPLLTLIKSLRTHLVLRNCNLSNLSLSQFRATCVQQSTLGTQVAHHQQSSQMAQTGQQLSFQLRQPTINQFPQRLEQQMPQNQGSQMAKPPAHQFAHQQLQYMTYQQSMHLHGQQSSQPPTQHNVQGQSFANQHEYKVVFAKREEEDFQTTNITNYKKLQLM